MDAQAHVVALGGIARRSALVARGVTPRALAAAIRAGSLRRIARGWYTTLPEGDPRVVAVSLGGVLTGAAALRLAGAWLWSAPRTIDVSMPPGASRPAILPRGVALTWSSEPRGEAVVASLEESLLHAVPRLPFDEAVAVLDWAHHTNRLDLVELHGLCARLGQDRRRIVEWVDVDCGRVLESIARTRLRARGHRLASQVPVDPLGEWRALGAIDLVVDGVVALELDGRTFHESTFESDRRKDLVILRGGRTAIRASREMVATDWTAVEDAVEAALARHRGFRRARARRQRNVIGWYPQWRLPRPRR